MTLPLSGAAAAALRAFSTICSSRLSCVMSATSTSCPDSTSSAWSSLSDLYCRPIPMSKKPCTVLSVNCSSPVYQNLADRFWSSRRSYASLAMTPSCFQWVSHISMRSCKPPRSQTSTAASRSRAHCSSAMIACRRVSMLFALRRETSTALPLASPILARPRSSRAKFPRARAAASWPSTLSESAAFMKDGMQLIFTSIGRVSTS
mmetsp:Transcript_13522/g.31119  ORF Transcript_13522/g.31119 Transcript_13522/m.31119 type:complete len:205 (-) Transcript_13522:1512-2126(-)